jgi:agmatine deiminase
VGRKEVGPAPGRLRLPAEWEPHEATWIGWPHNPDDWPGKFGAIPWVFGEIVRKLADGEMVRIVVESKDHEAKARRLLARVGVDPAKLEFFRFPTDRGWMRDSGPAFVETRDGSGTAIVRFRFNGWARYDNWRKDDAIPGKVARALGIPIVPGARQGREIVLEGGAIEVNGKGTLMTTEECLLDEKIQTRNPGLGRREYEEIFRNTLGAENILWLGRGIEGDDTHGHIDDLCRFVSTSTVVYCHEERASDPNYRALEENRERLAGMRLENGSRIEAVPLPMPAPLYFDDRRLPASYANFYVANAAVLVPTFNDSNDRVALGALAELFPGRLVLGIHAVDLVWGLGTLHCLTRQQPLRDRSPRS